MSVFLETNHLFARSPGGEVQNCAAMRDAGFGAIFCNIDPNAYTLDLWDTVRQEAKKAGIKCGPWLRTADANTVFDPSRLELLIDTADAWDWAPLICNSEKEIDHTGADLTRYIAEQIGDRDAAISVEVRPFGAVDWKPVAGYPILPQNFPAETGIMDSDDTIRMNWYAAGAQCVVITYGTYHGMQPTQFARLDPYGLYTANDCGGVFEPWASLGSCVPCRNNGGEENEVDMTLIGHQDGIVAEYNALRDLDPAKTILQKTSGKWPELATISNVPLEKWKAWDKAQRRAQILKDDHDAKE